MGDLTSVFQMIIGFMLDVINKVAEKTSFSAFGFTVNFWSVLLAFFVVTMVVSIFWRGAKS